MISGGMSNVVAELILLLIAQRREESNRCGELIIAVGLKARRRQRCCAEWKLQCEAEHRIPRLGQMQCSRIEYKCPQPGWTERKRIAHHAVPVVVVGRQPGRRQRCLLYQIVVS